MCSLDFRKVQQHGYRLGAKIGLPVIPFDISSDLVMVIINNSFSVTQVVYAGKLIHADPVLLIAAADGEFFEPCMFAVVAFAECGVNDSES
jgi:hypothetical protein